MSDVNKSVAAQNNTDDNQEEELSIADGFVINLLDFINVCIDVLKRIEGQGVQLKFGSKLIVVAYDYIKAQKSEIVIRKFIDRSHANWHTCIGRKKEELMPNIKSLFLGIKEEYVDSMMEIFSIKHGGKPVVTDEDEATMWDYIFEFIKLAILYVHEQRCWGMLPPKTEGDEAKPGYSKVYQKDIKVKSTAEMFNVALDYSVEVDELTDQLDSSKI